MSTDPDHQKMFWVFFNTLYLTGYTVLCKIHSTGRHFYRFPWNLVQSFLSAIAWKFSWAKRIQQHWLPFQMDCPRPQNNLGFLSYGNVFLKEILSLHHCDFLAHFILYCIGKLVSAGYNLFTIRKFHIYFVRFKLHFVFNFAKLGIWLLIKVW